MVKQQPVTKSVPLAVEQEELAQAIYQRIRVKMDEELLALARLMASQKDHEIFGKGEFELRDKLNAVGATLLEEAANERSKKGYCGSSCACACGASTKFMGWRKKTVMSIFGYLRLLGSYYYCADCGRSQQPWDAVLRLDKRRVTPGAREAITLAGLLTRFGQAARATLVKLTGITAQQGDMITVGTLSSTFTKVGKQ